MGLREVHDLVRSTKFVGWRVHRQSLPISKWCLQSSWYYFSWVFYLKATGPNHVFFNTKKKVNIQEKSILLPPHSEWCHWVSIWGSLLCKEFKKHSHFITRSFYTIIWDMQNSTPASTRLSTSLGGCNQIQSTRQLQSQSPIWSLR